MRKELLLGCGANLAKRLSVEPYKEWTNLVTLDQNPDHDPQVLWDLEKLPLPFEDDEFDEIHAYHVLEHTGAQGDYRFFFAQFSDFWRMLKPDGLLFAAVPAGPTWTWGDPGHRRVINPGSLVFLSQANYEQNVGVTPMCDYRRIYKADLVLQFQDVVENEIRFALKAVKCAKAE